MTKRIKYHAIRIVIILFFSWCFMSSIYDVIVSNSGLTLKNVFGLFIHVLIIISIACEAYSSHYTLKSPMRIYEEKKMSGNLLLNVTVFLLFSGLVLAIIFGGIYKASGNTMDGMTPLEALCIVATVIILGLVIVYYEGCKVEKKDITLEQGDK